MSESILPCPFCGLVPDVNNPATFQHETGSRWASVVCCVVGPEIRAGIYTPLEEWKDEAIAAWNERAPQTAQPAIPVFVYNELARGLEVLEEEYGAQPGIYAAREWLRARAQKPPPAGHCHQ